MPFESSSYKLFCNNPRYHIKRLLQIKTVYQVANTSEVKFASQARLLQKGFKVQLGLNNDLFKKRIDFQLCFIVWLFFQSIESFFRLLEVLFKCAWKPVIAWSCYNGVSTWLCQQHSTKHGAAVRRHFVHKNEGRFRAFSRACGNISSAASSNQKFFLAPKGREFDHS